MKILYTASINDSSGYGEAARNYIASLLTQPNIELSSRPMNCELWKTDTSKYDSIIGPTINKPIKPDVQIIHMTPENFPRCKIPGIKNIGYTVWETSRLPNNWVSLCNQLDAILVPCSWNVDVFKSSGVSVPVIKVPHTINIKDFNIDGEMERIDAIPQDKYIFYSIFQWTARKNPVGLISAYLSEFRPSDKVCLVIKSYMENNSDEDKTKVISAITEVRKSLQLMTYNTAQIILVHGALSSHGIMSLHNQGDCFVLPHRAEGWGVPIMEAMLFGKPAIATGFSGNMEFMNKDNSYLIDYNITPVSGMGKPTYHGWMDWAEPHICSIRNNMRHVYENQDRAKIMGEVGRQSLSRLDWNEVGKLFVEAIGKVI